MKRHFGEHEMTQKKKKLAIQKMQHGPFFGWQTHRYAGSASVRTLFLVSTRRQLMHDSFIRIRKNRLGLANLGTETSEVSAWEKNFAYETFLFNESKTKPFLLFFGNFVHTVANFCFFFPF